jgi:D-serine deaminase-like pyridoxal phosphate-dependent protein
MTSTRKEFLNLGIGLAFASAVPTIWSRSVRSGYSEREISDRLRAGDNLKGMHRDELPTPSLLLDLDKFEYNLNKMSRHAQESNIDLRPHAKMHKCAEIARRQRDAGAIGICAATINEAEMLANEGLRGILITSEMVGREKIRRLVALTRDAPDTMSVVDHPRHADQLSEAAVAVDLTLNLMLDIDPVGRRTGVQPGEDAKRLARHIASLPNLQLLGVHSYSGASSHVNGFEERKAHSRKVMGPPIQTWRQLRQEGMDLEIFSGGSTGTYNIDTEIDDFTELQVGSYLFMDIDYRTIGGRSGEIYDDFQQALTVLGTVISKNHDDRATVDSGIKSFATDRSFGPELVGFSGVEYRLGGDEHGILLLENPDREIRRGDRLEFYVPHCDPNVNLYSRLHCMRGDTVEDVWQIAGKHL